MPLITVGIPVFNAMPYLPESLESIRRQTHADFEILVINDGSTDGSREYLASVQDSRLRVIDQRNRGITATLNRMLAEVNTPWLARHDADDVAYPQRIARAAECIGQRPDAAMFYSLAEYYPKGSVGTFRATKGTPSDIRSLVLSGYLPAICHPTVTLNVRKAVDAGGYRFDLHVEDIDLWWRLALKEEIRLIPEVLVGFRQNVQSVSSGNLAIQAINTLFVQYLLLSHIWGLTPLPYQEAAILLARLYREDKLEFKKHIRAFNMAMGRHHYANALSEMVRAGVASPSEFSRRVLDEVFGCERICLGEPPQRFLKWQSALWPAGRTPLAFVSSIAEEPMELSAAHRETKV